LIFQSAFNLKWFGMNHFTLQTRLFDKYKLTQFDKIYKSLL